MYRFIDENTVERFEKGFVVLDNTIYTNPSNETLTQAGYKPLITEDAPQYDDGSQYLVKKYIDGDDSITEMYEVVTIQQPDGWL